MQGKLQYWKGWVRVKVEGEELTFTGHRDTEDNAMRDASRRSVLYLRHRYDDVFDQSIF